MKSTRNVIIQILLIASLTASCRPQLAEAADRTIMAAPPTVRYEDFGAKGDGFTDDLPAICAAHEYANRHGRSVRSNPNATYHLGRQALTAVIATATDWSTTRFIIDDSQGVDAHRQPVFVVGSLLPPIEVAISRLTRDQKQLNVRPEQDCLVFVEDANQKRFIRRGLNRNAGTPQREVFILRRDGSIEGAINWDYANVTTIEAKPLDPTPLVLRGGLFIHIANRVKQEAGYTYWSRGIQIKRSNTEVNGLTCLVVGETDVGQPYGGFLSAYQCANITFRDCNIAPRKMYRTIGTAGEPVGMGSYGYSASLVVNFRMINCRMEGINDRSRWGVVHTDFMKNVVLEDCVLSRMDVHQGVSGDYIIRRCTLGYAGLNAIGRGRLVIEDSTLHGGNLISFRGDYGSTWEGDVAIRDSRWIPNAGNPIDQAFVFGMRNDGMHDFGYPCFMPRAISIDGLFIDDSNASPEFRGVMLFSDPIGDGAEIRPFPYALTRTLHVRNLKTASGIPPRISPSEHLAHAIAHEIFKAVITVIGEDPERSFVS